MTCVRGATLIEVLIAVAVLAIGVLAAFGLQASSLQGTRSAAIGQDLTNIALSELDLQRAFTRTVIEPAQGLTCRTNAGPFECEVAVYPCTLTAATWTLACANSSISVEQYAARQVVVEVTGRNGRRVELSTVVR